MGTLDTLNQQILDQITTRTRINIFYNSDKPRALAPWDDEQLEDEQLSLAFMDDGAGYLIFPIYGAFKLSPDSVKNMKEMFTDEQPYNTSPEVIRTNMSREKFLKALGIL